MQGVLNSAFITCSTFFSHSLSRNSRSSFAIPAHVVMTSFRPIMTSHAYVNLSLGPLTRRTPSVIPPRVLPRSFHHPTHSGVPANKPAQTASRSTLIPSSIPAASRDARVCFALGRTSIKSLVDLPTISPSRDAVSSTAIPAKFQNHCCNQPSSSILDSKARPKALERESLLSVLKRISQVPQPSGDIVVIRSSLLEDLWRGLNAVIQKVGDTAWKIIRAVIGVFTAGILVFATLDIVWRSLTGQTVQTKQEFCRRCGKLLMTDGWYWRDDLPEDTPMQQRKIVCWTCSKLLRREGHSLVFVEHVRK